MEQKLLTTPENKYPKSRLEELYAQHLEQSHDLGKIVEENCPHFGVSDQKTRMFEGGTTQYPDKVKQALIEIVQEYNIQFGKLLESTRKDPEEYKYCDGDQFPTSLGLQIDMVALPPEVLEYCSQDETSLQEIVVFLKRHIFEIENNLAGYNFLGAMCPQFTENLKTSIQKYREASGKKVYLLATTLEKYDSIKVGEFGQEDLEQIKDSILEQTGFDGLIGPEQFQQMVESGQEPPLFYTRCSLDTSELRNPGKSDTAPSLLDNPKYVELIRQNTITPNVDYPDSEVKTNDTKQYMEGMGLGYNANSIEDILDPEFVHFLSNSSNLPVTPEILNPKFVEFCRTRNIDPQKILDGEVELRAKPLQESYGCYGHLTQMKLGKKFAKKLTKEIKKRGPYVIQPELDIMKVTNKAESKKYLVIDRNFVMVDSDGEYKFVCGFRSYSPADSEEAKKNNVHGNRQTVYSIVN